MFRYARAKSIFKDVQELSLREITLEVLNYMWSLPKVTHVVSIAAGDRTKASLAELQGGEGEPDLFFLVFRFLCEALAQATRISGCGLRALPTLLPGVQESLGYLNL